jgi:tRNA A37 threonylcarbamoyladenosine synthetase subunit TsaC/SUA5/YrdC
MTDPRMVGGRQSEEALTAVTAGRVVAVASDEGYCLAMSLSARDVLSTLRGLAPYPAGPAAPHVMVGGRSQAVDLASVWSKETAFLTDRMWPGPLTVIVPAYLDMVASDEPVVHLTMPTARGLRALCRTAGPLAVRALLRADGAAVVDPNEVGARFSEGDLALIVNGGVCRGPGPTVVDCTVTPPAVRRVGALPESYVDAALMMGARRRRWFRKASPEQPPH